MKKHTFLSMFFVIILLFSSCKMSSGTTTGNNQLQNEDVQTPMAAVSDTNGMIPQLADDIPFDPSLLESKTMFLYITQYDMNYLVKNAEDAQMRMNHGKIEENEIHAIEGFGTIEETVTDSYEVDSSTAYTFSYDTPHENCFFKVAWTDELFASARGSGIQTVECSLSGVRLTGENMVYTIKYYLDDEDQAILKVTGSGENAVCLMRTEDGFRFYCEKGAVMELPDFYEEKAVRSLDIPAGRVGVIEGISKGYQAELYTEAFLT